MVKRSLRQINRLYFPIWTRALLSQEKSDFVRSGETRISVFCRMRQRRSWTSAIKGRKHKKRFNKSRESVFCTGICRRIISASPFLFAPLVSHVVTRETSRLEIVAGSNCAFQWKNKKIRIKKMGEEYLSSGMGEEVSGYDFRKRWVLSWHFDLKHEFRLFYVNCRHPPQSIKERIWKHYGRADSFIIKTKRLPSKRMVNKNS